MSEDANTRAQRSLLSLRDLPAETWEQLLVHAEQLAGPDGRRPLLAGLRFGMLLLAPSLRTRTSFEVAAGDLGARALALVPGEGLWQLEHRDGVVMDGAAAEHVREAAGVLGRMVDGMGLRAFAGLADADLDRSEPVLTSFARHCPVPVLNLESALDHPHQGLADALTVRRHVGERARVVVRWAPHVKPLPMAVPHAALLAFAREGHEVIVAHPEGYDLDAGVVTDAERLASASGGSVSVTHDRHVAQAGAAVIYAKAWGSRTFYGDVPASTADLASRRDWIVTPDDLAAGDNARFMHCLPVRRGVVVDDAVLNGPASLVLEQASARLDVQKATLCHAAGVTP